MSHSKGINLDLSKFVLNYAYKVLCPTGFSPRFRAWREFQDWFYRVEQDPQFQPYVPDILPSKWYLSERAKGGGRERDLWDMWHIYFSNQHGQFTVMLNTLSSGLLAVNRHEAGLHDAANQAGPREPLCETWSDEYIKFPDDLPLYDFDGLPI